MIVQDLVGPGPAPSSDEKEFHGFEDGDYDDEDDEIYHPPTTQGWKQVSAPDDRAPERRPPLTMTPGVTAELGPAEKITPKSCLDLLITEELIKVVVEETNRYAAQRLTALGDRFPSARIRQ